MSELVLPEHYDPMNAERWGYNPDLAALLGKAIEYRNENGITAAATDKTRILTLIIDAQKDFCHKEGTLFVAGRSGDGAIEDSKRTAEFIYRNSDVITDVTTTLDTHFAFQCFTAPFWQTSDGQPLSPHTLIDIGIGGNLVNLSLTGDVLHDNVTPNPALAKELCGGSYKFLMQQMRHYVEELKKGGKYTLYIWPPHTVLGSEGHALVGVIHEARQFHAFCRSSQTKCEVKGGNPFTENYSVLGGEVLTRFDGKGAIAQKNTRFIQQVLDYDAVAILGQASSHCTKSTIEDLLAEIVAKDPSLARKVYVVRDCMSAVTVPGANPGTFAADFTDDAEKALDKFANAGMNVVNSTDDIRGWPGMQLADRVING